MPGYESRPRVLKNARHLGEYKLWLEFDDGRSGVVDLAEDLNDEAFEPLRDPARFAQFYIDDGMGALTWHQGADLDAEFLYDKLSSVH